jgi:hypothetical protein
MADGALDIRFGAAIQLRYFSLARYALAEAFRVLDLHYWPFDKRLGPAMLMNAFGLRF